MLRDLFPVLLICALAIGCRTGGASPLAEGTAPGVRTITGSSASAQLAANHGERPRLQFASLQPGHASGPQQPRMVPSSADRIPLPESGGNHVRQIDLPRRSLATGIGAF